MINKVHFSVVASLDNRKKAGALILPFWKGKKQAEAVENYGLQVPGIELPIKSNDFTGKEGEVLFLYQKGGLEPRIALLGIGDKKEITMERLRRAYSNLTQECRVKKIDEINLVIPKDLSVLHDEVIRGIAEGLLLSNYIFDKHKGNKDDQLNVLLKKINLVGGTKKDLEIANKSMTIIEGVYLTRDLVNGNADDVTPDHLVKIANGFAKQLNHVKTTVFDKKRIQKEKMGLILAVNRGSHRDPAFIIIDYKGDPKSRDKTVIIGKGITYDTGGLNLKPTGSMEEMKCDMAGSATVLGTIYAIANLGLKVNVTAVIPATENSIDSMSYKPGDVYTSYSGKTVEIGNTDAEGRLILADALSYTVKNLKPTRIVDFATLTGAMVIALGEETTGLMSNDDVLADSLLRAGHITFERLCRLPVYEEYREQIKSEIADLKNTGGRPAGSITAAMFLKEFVGETPWAHLDIAGTAFLSKQRRYHPKFGTGIGVRLMVEFLESLAN